MDLQGIGAVSAAAVTLFGIPAALVVGRWQLRAALRASEETARAGLAQADASYRAALDAVRAQGHVEHAQWRRGVQRDAYAAFLQSVLSYHDCATNLEPSAEEAEMRSRTAELKPLKADMSHKGWVVRLEGPEEVSSAARDLQVSAEVLAVVMRGHVLRMSAIARITERAHTHAQEVTRVWELIPCAQGFWHTIGTAEMEDSSTEVLEELRRLFARLELSQGLIPTICDSSSESPSLDLPSFDEAINAFLRAARSALHPQ
ncbi:hypothetical protein [Streptomyces sp. NPDC056982]|uniref:hypothetical protein n=1 Tax=Streptomyces sp. NPDC056982 TaxID=3345986 RepID=UPI003644FA46